MAKKNSLKKLINEFRIGGFVGGYRHQVKLDKGWAHIVNERDADGKVCKVNEGPAYEYAKYTKNIEKSWENTQKAVMGLVKELHKKGFRKEALMIEKKYQASIRNFYHYFAETMNKLQ